MSVEDILYELMDGLGGGGSGSISCAWLDYKIDCVCVDCVSDEIDVERI